MIENLFIDRLSRRLHLQHRTIRTRVNIPVEKKLLQNSLSSHLEIDYIVTVQTGSVASSGTDAHVFISLNGDHYKINHYPLQKSESGKNPFEKDSRDVFKFNDTDLGRVRLADLRVTKDTEEDILASNDYS